MSRDKQNCCLHKVTQCTILLLILFHTVAGVPQEQCPSRRQQKARSRAFSAEVGHNCVVCNASKDKQQPPCSHKYAAASSISQRPYLHPQRPNSSIIRARQACTLLQSIWVKKRTRSICLCSSCILLAVREKPDSVPTNPSLTPQQRADHRPASERISTCRHAESRENKKNTSSRGAPDGVPLVGTGNPIYVEGFLESSEVETKRESMAGMHKRTVHSAAEQKQKILNHNGGAFLAGSVSGMLEAAIVHPLDMVSPLTSSPVTSAFCLRTFSCNASVQTGICCRFLPCRMQSCCKLVNCPTILPSVQHDTKKKLKAFFWLSSLAGQNQAPAQLRSE